jgi:hypothetical protein
MNCENCNSVKFTYGNEQCFCEKVGKYLTTDMDDYCIPFTARDKHKELIFTPEWCPLPDAGAGG